MTAFDYFLAGFVLLLLVGGFLTYRKARERKRLREANPPANYGGGGGNRQPPKHEQ